MTTRLIRPLSPGEVALSRSVFGEAIDCGRVRIAAAGPFGLAITAGSVIAFPPDAPGDFGPAELRLQAWLIHELTHVWQWATAPAWTLASWAKAAVTGGYGRELRAYAYALPLRRFEDYGLEQQASIVEHAFLLREGGSDGSAPDGARWADYRARTPFGRLA